MTKTEDKKYEYAIRRNTDGAWLYDADVDGEDTAWEGDADNATWLSTEAEAVALADINGLTVDEDDDEPELSDGYRVWRREWTYEEDIDEDWESPEPEPVED